MNRFEFLNRFHPISTEDYNFLIENLTTKKFKKSDFLVVPGQTQREIYFVEEGIQMAYFNTDNKTHVSAFTYFPNLCAIPQSFSTQTPSVFYLQCLTPSTFLCCSFNQLQHIFKQKPALETLFRKITEFILAGVISRHVELQSFTIEERFKSFCNRSPHLLNQVPHKYIASYLGINPTNFSKLFNTTII